MMDLMKRDGVWTKFRRLAALTLALCLALLSGCGGVGAGNGEMIGSAGDQNTSAEAPSALVDGPDPPNDTNAPTIVDGGPVSGTALASGEGMPDWLKYREEQGENMVLHYYVIKDPIIDTWQEVVAMTIQPDGTRTSVYPDGTEAEYGADGGLRVKDPVGVRTEIPPTGDSVTFITPDGTRMTKYAADGRIMVEYPDGVGVGTFPGVPFSPGTVETARIRYPYGMGSTRDENDEWTFLSYIGRCSAEDDIPMNGRNVHRSRLDLPDGTSVIFQEDGHTSATYPNGTKVNVSGTGAVTVEYCGISDHKSDDTSTLLFLPNGPETIVRKQGTTVYNPGRVTVERSYSATTVRYPDGVTTQVDSSGDLSDFTFKDPGMEELSRQILSILGTPTSDPGPIVTPPDSAANHPDGEQTPSTEAPTAPQGRGGLGSAIVSIVRLPLIVILVVLAVSLTAIFKKKARDRNGEDWSAEDNGIHYKKKTQQTITAGAGKADEQKKSSSDPKPTDPVDNVLANRVPPVYLGYSSSLPQRQGAKPVLTEMDGGELCVTAGRWGESRVDAYPRMIRIANAGNDEGSIDARNLDNGPIKDCFQIYGRNDYTGRVLRIRVDAPATLERDGSYAQDHVLETQGSITVVGVG